MTKERPPLTPDDVETSFITFGEEILGYNFYPWQCDAIEPFDDAALGLVQVSLATPNGSGKSAVVIPTLVLGWLSLYPRGRVVLTTADGRQLDSQVMPAIEAHRAKFPGWKFIEREVCNATGGRFVCFTTDNAGRAEGWHKLDDLDGPLLWIADEAKTVPDEIFGAIDRCTYNAILVTSSPGPMNGRFYDTQFRKELGYRIIRIGLKDCPHITQDKIDRIIAQHGADSAFTRSTLHGEFMEAEGEARFDAEGLKALREMADVEAKATRASIYRLTEQASGRVQPVKDESGFVWCIEEPIPGCEYVGFCDPMTGEQSEGSKVRDGCGAGIIRKAFTDEAKVLHDDEVVAVLHASGGVRWANDVMSDRLSMLLRWYGDCTCIVEANNYGGEVIRLLLQHGRTLWRREKPNHRIPGKKMIDVVGFQTTASSKNIWIGALAMAIAQRTLVCRYLPAVEQMQTFILDENGRGAAQQGCHDDFVTGIGLGLFALPASATRLRTPERARVWTGAHGGRYSDENAKPSVFA
jgi:hypothetical protein